MSLIVMMFDREDKLSKVLQVPDTHQLSFLRPSHGVRGVAHLEIKCKEDIESFPVFGKVNIFTSDGKLIEDLQKDYFKEKKK